MTKTRTWLIAVLLLAVLLRAGVAVYLGDTLEETRGGTYDQISLDARLIQVSVLVWLFLGGLVALENMGRGGRRDAGTRRGADGVSWAGVGGLQRCQHDQN